MKVKNKNYLILASRGIRVIQYQPAPSCMSHMGACAEMPWERYHLNLGRQVPCRDLNHQPLTYGNLPVKCLSKIEKKYFRGHEKRNLVKRNRNLNLSIRKLIMCLLRAEQFQKKIFDFIVRFPVILLSDQGAHIRRTWIYGKSNKKIEDFSLKMYCSQNILTLSIKLSI